ISCEETYARDLSDFQEMASELERMSGQLAASLSRKRLRARTVTIKVRYADFTTVTRSHTAEDASNSEGYIADCARTLLARTAAGDAGVEPVCKIPPAAADAGSNCRRHVSLPAANARGVPAGEIACATRHAGEVTTRCVVRAAGNARSQAAGNVSDTGCKC